MSTGITGVKTTRLITECFSSPLLHTLWQAPPLRICLLGPRGSGKTICGRKLAESFGVFHIQFDEFLQEKMMLKAERKYGPEFEDDSEEEQATKQELEELAVQANVKIEEESIKKQVTWGCPWGCCVCCRSWFVAGGSGQSSSSSTGYTRSPSHVAN